MDFLEFVTKVIAEFVNTVDALAWPLVALVVALVFKEPLTRLIDRTKKLGKEGAEFEQGQEQA